MRRQHAGAVTGVYARFFHVLHDSGDQNTFAIGKRIDIYLSGLFEEAIHQHRPVLREADRLTHVLFDSGLFIRDHHGAAAQHIAGANQHRVTDLASYRDSLLNAGGRSVGR